jgi:hypothetical protein
MTASGLEPATFWLVAWRLIYSTAWLPSQGQPLGGGGGDQTCSALKLSVFFSFVLIYFLLSSLLRSSPQLPYIRTFRLQIPCQAGLLSLWHGTSSGCGRKCERYTNSHSGQRKCWYLVYKRYGKCYKVLRVKLVGQVFLSGDLSKETDALRGK